MGWPKGKPRNKPAWNSGLTKETSAVIAASAEKVSSSLKGRTTITEDGRARLSAAVSDEMHRRYANGWSNKGGRCKKFDYESPIAGIMSLDGTWELLVAKHLDSLNVSWVRNTTRFKYVKPTGEEASYCPDFYVRDWDAFIEVKGYETELDRAKWQQFPHKLQIWKRDKVKNLGR